jgi:hypothetical protein
MATPVPVYVQYYHADVKQYGPLPPPYKAVRSGPNDELRYTTRVKVSGKQYDSEHHPLSPRGREMEMKCHSHRDERHSFPGIHQVLFHYHGENFAWSREEGPLQALHEALTSTDFPSVDLHELRQRLADADALPNLSRELYHPADR